MRFISYLKYMGIGMLGVFVIILIIMAATYIIGRLAGARPGDSE